MMENMNVTNNNPMFTLHKFYLFLITYYTFIEYYHYGAMKARLDLNHESKNTLLTATCDAHSKWSINIKPG